MSGVANPEGSRRSILLATTGLLAGAVMLNAAATQYVAYRVGYHPAIGAPVFGHVYAAVGLDRWQQAAWADQCAATFKIV